MILLLNKYLSSSDSAIYFLAFQCSLVLGIACDSLNKALVPFFYEALARKNIQERIRIVKITYLISATLVIIYLLSYLIAPLIVPILFGAEYIQVSIIVPWLVLGQVFGGFYLLFCNYLFYAKKTNY